MNAYFTPINIDFSNTIAIAGATDIAVYMNMDEVFYIVKNMPLGGISFNDENVKKMIGRAFGKIKRITLYNPGAHSKYFNHIDSYVLSRLHNLLLILYSFRSIENYKDESGESVMPIIIELHKSISVWMENNIPILVNKDLKAEDFNPDINHDNYYGNI